MSVRYVSLVLLAAGLACRRETNGFGPERVEVLARIAATPVTLAVGDTTFASVDIQNVTDHQVYVDPGQCLGDFEFVDSNDAVFYPLEYVPCPLGLYTLQPLAAGAHLSVTGFSTGRVYGQGDMNAIRDITPGAYRLRLRIRVVDGASDTDVLSDYATVTFSARRQS